MRGRFGVLGGLRLRVVLEMIERLKRGLDGCDGVYRDVGVDTAYIEYKA